jgi:hypothetical protein
MVISPPKNIGILMMVVVVVVVAGYLFPPFRKGGIGGI